jgi:hypothetical protein
MKRLFWTYYTDTFAKDAAGRKIVKDVYDRFERFHDLAIFSSKLAESLYLTLKNGRDRIHRVAILELLCEKLVIQFRACLLCVVLQGGIEERLEG